MQAEIEIQKRAKQFISEILTHLKVVRVIYIDDAFESTWDKEQVIGWAEDAYQLSPDITKELLPSIDFQIPDRAWTPNFEHLWEKWNLEQRFKTVNELLKVIGGDSQADREFITALKLLFPRKFRVEQFTPAMWEEQQAHILSGGSHTTRILCLFDQDLSNSPGYTASGTRSGIGLLKNLVLNDSANIAICGLLTHTRSYAVGVGKA